MTVNNQTLTTDAVKCTQLGDLTTIDAGTGPDAGVTAMVDSSAGLMAKSVTIRDVGAFSGSFWPGLQGHADVTMTAGTYTIAGSAQGFASDRPNKRIDGNFVVTVAC